MMNTLEEIEVAIARLPAEDFAKLSEWILRKRSEAWDRQIEEDSASGALDALLQEVSDDIAQGRVKPLDEICRDR